MNSKIKKLLLIVLLSIISLIIPNSVKADSTGTSSVDKSKVEVSYTIKIKKIDTDTKELLKGAEFELKDTEGNIVKKARTDENGDLSFGEITTLGSGIDTYYIRETSTPAGYAITEKEDIQVKVIKNIDNDGNYNLKIECETLNYSFDITRYDYIPVSTVDQLKKIGSGEEVEYKGVKYTYSANGNYKLVNDIDLEDEQWTPINKKISGIFDGNGHSIKNLNIVPKNNGKFEYSEIGLFKYFSGVVQNLDLQNVKIVATSIDIDPVTSQPKESISGKIGVGAFAGFMEKGIVKNCTVSGQMVSCYNNLGGFVGHSAEKNIIKFQNCTSSVNLTFYRNGKDIYNAGGMIGCAVGSVSFEDCIFEGSFIGDGNNIGGLVGFTDSDGYEEYGVKAGYVEDDNEITLLIGNSRIKGKYDLVLQNRDISTLGLIAGAKYAVYDSDFKKMKGFENIQLENGELKIENIEIKVVGTDIFYIKELEPAPGYQKLNSYIKLIVTRYWDTETDSFKVRVDVENIGDSKIEDDKKGSFDGILESKTGSTLSSDVKFENVGWNNAKVLFVNCNNKGSIQGNRDIGGLLGTSYCKVEMNGCQNYGEVKAQGSGKAAGLICKIDKQSKDFLVKIENCCNEGTVGSYTSSGTDCASGILGQVIADIEIKNCINKADITGTISCAVSGILADYYGSAEISECVNNGNLTISSSNPGNVNGVVGGILAKNYVPSYGINTTKEKNNINIYNCINTGNIKSETHCGGIIGLSTGQSVKIQNCMNHDNDIVGAASDKGGMMGFASVKSLEIVDCTTERSNFSQTTQNTYGFTGGILGDFTCYGSSPYTYGKNLIIKGCKVSDCVITSMNKEPAGIFGGGYIGSDSSNKDYITISNCDVQGCTIENRNARSTYSGSAGIYGVTYNASNININNCNLTDCTVSSLMASGSGGSDTNVGGIIAAACGVDSINLKDNTVEKCEFKNTAPGDTCANTAGILAYQSLYNSYNSSGNVCLVIDNCDVKKSSFSCYSGNLGGTVAMTHYTSTEIKNCDNIENTLNSEAVNSSNTDTGGIIAGAQGDISIINCSVIGNEEEKSSIYGRGRNVSGIIGWAMNNVTTNNVRVENMQIKSEGAQYSSYSIDTVAGVLGYSNGVPKFEACYVENCDINGYVANAAGLLGSSSTSYCTSFNDISIKDTDISNIMFCARAYGNSTSSGLLGYLGSSNYGDQITEYKNITIDGCNITGAGGTTSGMISVCNGGDFDNCTVKNTNISKKDPSQYGTHGTTTSIAGMISASNSSNLYMNDCKIEKVNIDGDCLSQGGFIGYCYGLKEFKNNTINNLKIIGNEGKCGNTNGGCNGSIGGIFGDLPVSDTIKLEDCDITDFIAESVYHNIGGMIGTTNSNITINESDLNGLNLKYTNEVSIQNPVYRRCVGGMVAISTGKTTITNGSVNDSEFTATTGTNNNSSIGSLIGYAKYKTEKEHNVIITECEISGNTIDNQTNAGMAGGIIGANYCEQKYVDGVKNELYCILDVSNVDISDSTITSTAGVGGVIGYGVEKVDDVNVDGCTIKNTSSNSNGAGGIVGMSLAVNDNSIENSTVSNSSVTSKSYAGGISGFTSGKIDNCTVTNTPVTTDASNGCIGGIAGFTYDPSSTVNNCTVSDCDISNTCVNESSSSNYHVGGIVGFTEGNLNKDIANNGTTVSVKGNNSTNSLGGILGMTSYSSGEINDCVVDDITVDGKNGFIGGIVGESNCIINNCDVSNATIESDADSSHGCGGIVGCGCSSTTIDECSIENSTVEANDNVGAVFGMGIEESCCSCTVENVTVIEAGESRVEPQEVQATELELENQNSLELMSEDLPSKSDPEIEDTKEEEIPNTSDSVEEKSNTEVEEPIVDSEQDIDQNSNDDSNIDVEDENKNDTQEGQDGDLNQKEDESTSDEIVDSELQDMVEPNTSDNGEGEQDEEEKNEDNQEPEPEIDNSLEKSESLQMPKEENAQDIQQENETSGEQ